MSLLSTQIQEMKYMGKMFIVTFSQYPRVGVNTNVHQEQRVQENVGCIRDGIPLSLSIVLLKDKK